MTDLEITKLCAEAMGFTTLVPIAELCVGDLWASTNSKRKGEILYAPLHNDAQAMALVKKFGLNIFAHGVEDWDASINRYTHNSNVDNSLNHAICECVARMVKMQASK